MESNRSPNLRTRPKCLIPDADVIIELHRIGQWSRVCNAVAVVVPGTVARQEALYYQLVDWSGAASSVPIRLEEQVTQGLFVVEDVLMSELDAVRAELAPAVVKGLHPGELEALAIVRRNPEHVLCTGDAAAVKALTYVGLAPRGISLEQLLRSCGLPGKGLFQQFTEERYREMARAASIDRVQGRGSARDLLRR